MLKAAGTSGSGGTVITNGQFLSLLIHVEAGLRNKRHPDPLPCFSSLPPSLAPDQQKPPMKPSCHPCLLTYSHAIEVAHQAMQQKLKLTESKVLSASHSLQVECLILGFCFFQVNLGFAHMFKHSEHSSELQQWPQSWFRVSKYKPWVVGDKNNIIRVSVCSHTVCHYCRCNTSKPITLLFSD